MQLSAYGNASSEKEPLVGLRYGNGVLWYMASLSPYMHMFVCTHISKTKCSSFIKFHLHNSLPMTIVQSSTIWQHCDALHTFTCGWHIKFPHSGLVLAMQKLHIGSTWMTLQHIQVLPKVIWEQHVATPHGRECTRALHVLAVQCSLQTSPVTQLRIHYIHTMIPHQCLDTSVPNHNLYHKHSTCHIAMRTWMNAKNATCAMLHLLAD